jgi:hypothetical protein
VNFLKKFRNHKVYRRVPALLREEILSTQGKDYPIRYAAKFAEYFKMKFGEKTLEELILEGKALKVWKGKVGKTIGCAGMLSLYSCSLFREVVTLWIYLWRILVRD